MEADPCFRQPAFCDPERFGSQCSALLDSHSLPPFIDPSLSLFVRLVLVMIILYSGGVLKLALLRRSMRLMSSQPSLLTTVYLSFSLKEYILCRQAYFMRPCAVHVFPRGAGSRFLVSVL